MEELFQGSPLDEIRFTRPEAVEYFGGITAENIHLYFMTSPFCDPTSNNMIIDSQSRANPEAMFPIVKDRAKFEARIMSMQGIEYIIVDGPKVTTPDMNPVWVIQKRRRTKHRKRVGRDGREEQEQDTVEILRSYYAIADAIYQAPSLLDLINGRLMNIERHMAGFFRTAAPMQFFTPSTGHSYQPATVKTREIESARTSRANTPAPEAVSASLTASIDPSSKKDPDFDAQAEAAFIASMNIATRFAGEYTDHNPLLGEPGSFAFTSTEGHVKEQAAAKARAAAERAEREARSTNGSNVSSPAPEAKLIKKGSRAEKTVAGGSKLKRRKSRITGSPEGEG